MSADPPTASRSRSAGPAGEPGGLLLTPAQARRVVALLDAAARYWGPADPGRAQRARTLAHALTPGRTARLDAAQARALPHLLRDGARCPDHASDPGWLLDGFALATHLEHATGDQARTRQHQPPARRQPTARAARAKEHPHER
jgi:hypothetical protein